MYMLQYDGLTMCRWLSQTGEVEECEVLHTLSTILGRVLSSVTSSEEDEVRYTSIISELRALYPVMQQLYSAWPKAAWSLQ